MIPIRMDGYEFEFCDSVNVFQFDDGNTNSVNLHGVIELKKVDILAELETFVHYIELKRRKKPIPRARNRVCKREDCEVTCENEDCEFKRYDLLNNLKNGLKYKCRDTLLYRFAEQKIEFCNSKPIIYTVLMDIEIAQMDILRKNLIQEIPVGIPKSIPDGRWKKPLIDECNVIDAEQWNQIPEFQSTVRLIDY